MKKLNKEQREAVEQGEGPLLIVAGAGTGKTTVITERIKHLIGSELAKPSEIAALTFTEKAAREMQERVDVAMPYGYTEMWISTFHSFCDRVLRDCVLQVGLDPRFKLMTSAEAVQLVRDNLFEFKLKYFRPLGNPNKFIGGMLQHFSRLQDEDINPKEYFDWVGKQKARGEEDRLEIEKWKELAEAYRKYDELKVKEGRMDFGDLIVNTLDLFRKRPNVLREYQKRFKYVLVDEYQDVNWAQSRLAIMLAGRKANITVTGDDDQSIYRFRGAAVSNMVQFRKEYPKAKVVTLVKNYRSSQEILDRAYDLIQHNNPDRLEVVEGIDKKLVALRQARGEQVVFIHEERVEEEAERVAREIKILTGEPVQYECKDIAILIRANNHAEPFMRALGRRGIAYQFLGPGRLFKQSAVVDLIAYLKVLVDPDDTVSFYRLLSVEELEINARELVRLTNQARKGNRSLFEVCREVKNEKIKRVVEIMEKHLKLVRKETAGQLLYWFLEETGLLTELLNPESGLAEKRAANISKFFDRLKSYEVDHEEATVMAVTDWIGLASELGESPLVAESDWGEVNAVNILTVHSSKGLEFPVVFLVNLVSQRFPSTERREQIPIAEELIREELPKGDFHLQEERRLFYVGMTRAKERLYLTAADYYGERKREKRLSPFIFEALGDKVVVAEQEEVGEQLSFLDYRAVGEEAKVEREELHIDYLSYSQINTFEKCPLHYKLQYILRIPTPPSAAMSLGTSVHEAMREIYARLLTRAVNSRSSFRPGKKLIEEVLRQNWVNAGYTSKKHENQAFEKAAGFLRVYLRREFDPKKLPAVVEKPFVVPLPFKKGERRLKIGGRLDRVDEIGKGVIEVVDYKTGERVPTQREVDGDLQLTMYTLAATLINEDPFMKKPEEVRLSLYYFEEQKKLTTARTKEQLAEAVEKIYQVRSEIEKSDFTCSGSYWCENCEFKMFCGVE